VVYAYVRLYGLNLECFYQRLIGKLSSAKEQRAPHRVHMDIKFGVAREGGGRPPSRPTTRHMPKSQFAWLQLLILRVIVYAQTPLYGT